jgi:hypothetical protein
MPCDPVSVKQRRHMDGSEISELLQDGRTSQRRGRAVVIGKRQTGKEPPIWAAHRVASRRAYFDALAAQTEPTIWGLGGAWIGTLVLPLLARTIRHDTVRAKRPFQLSIWSNSLRLSGLCNAESPHSFRQISSGHCYLCLHCIH